MALFNKRATKQPVPPTPEPVPQIKPEDVQLCASCGVIGAQHAVKSGDFYLGPITLRLCGVCLDKRIENRCNQNFRQRREWPNTSVRLMAIDTAKQRAK